MLLVLTVLACRPADPGDTPPASASDPPSAALPGDPGPPTPRRPVPCCTDPESQALVRACLDLGTALAAEDTAAIPARSAALAEAARAVDASVADPVVAPAVASRIAALALRSSNADVPLAREYLAEISALLVPSVAASPGGSLDLGLACDHGAGWSWAQEGMDLVSPYGTPPDRARWGPCPGGAR